MVRYNAVVIQQLLLLLLLLMMCSVSSLATAAGFHTNILRDRDSRYSYSHNNNDKSTSTTTTTTNKITCPKSGATQANISVNGFDPIRRYTEISGLAFSSSQTSPSTGNPIMYVINDGGDNEGGRFGMYDSGTGERLLTLEISNTTLARHYDWEALALGPCGYMPAADTTVSNNKECIYIADVGDNVARATKGKRSDRTNNNPYRIIKLVEPRLDQYDASELGQESHAVTIPPSDVFTLTINYEHSSSPSKVADCEAMFLDPVGWGSGGAPGDLYLVTKWNLRNVSATRLFQIPALAWSSHQEEEEDVEDIFRQQEQPPKGYSPQAVGTYSTNPITELQSNTWTGADMTRDGTLIALSSYDSTFLFLRCPGSTIAEALTGRLFQSCRSFPHPSPGQVETSAFTADGKYHFEIPEGPRATIGKTNLIYTTESNNNNNNDSFLTECPQVEWVVAVGGETPTFCRTRDDRKASKPNEWCHYSTDIVPIVFLSEEDNVDDPTTASMNPSRSEDDGTRTSHPIIISGGDGGSEDEDFVEWDSTVVDQWNSGASLSWLSSTSICLVLTLCLVMNCLP